MLGGHKFHTLIKNVFTTEIATALREKDNTLNPVIASTGGIHSIHWAKCPLFEEFNHSAPHNTKGIMKAKTFIILLLFI